MGKTAIILMLFVISKLATAFPADYFCNGQLQQSGSVRFYPNGQQINSGAVRFYPNGKMMNSGSVRFYPNGEMMKSGSIAFYPNRKMVNSGSMRFYPNGQTINSGNTCFHPNGELMGQCPSSITLREPFDGYLYEMTISLTGSDALGDRIRFLVQAEKFLMDFEVSYGAPEILWVRAYCR